MTDKPKSYLSPGLTFAALVFVLDQLSKYFITDIMHLGPGRSVELLPFFNFSLVWNTGVSFGMFAGHGQAVAVGLTLLTSVIALVMIGWLSRAEDQTTAFALAAIIGGAFGNIVDRVRYSAVVDFLDFHIGHYHWPAFNVADASIFLGVVVLAWGSIFGDHKRRVLP